MPVNKTFSVDLLTLKISYPHVYSLKWNPKRNLGNAARRRATSRYYSLITPGVCLRSDRFSLCGECPFACSIPRSLPLIRSRYSACTRANAAPRRAAPARLRCVSTLYRHGITCMLRRAQQYSHIGSDISFQALSSYRGINVKRTRRPTRLDYDSTLSTQGTRLASSLSSCSLTGFRPFSFSDTYPIPDYPECA